MLDPAQPLLLDRRDKSAVTHQAGRAVAVKCVEAQYDQFESPLRFNYQATVADARAQGKRKLPMYRNALHFFRRPSPDRRMEAGIISKAKIRHRRLTVIRAHARQTKLVTVN